MLRRPPSRGGGSVVIDSSSLLIKPEVAREQLEAGDIDHGGDGGTGGGGDDRNGGTITLPKRFYASATLNPDRAGRDAGRIAEEILSRLSALPGANVKVTMEIEAEILDGVPEDVQRTVSENAGGLQFDLHGFERE